MGDVLFGKGMPVNGASIIDQIASSQVSILQNLMLQLLDTTDLKSMQLPRETRFFFFPWKLMVAERFA